MKKASKVFSRYRAVQGKFLDGFSAEVRIDGSQECMGKHCVKIDCHFTRKLLPFSENNHAVFKIIMKKLIYIIVLLENIHFLLPPLMFPSMP